MNPTDRLGQPLSVGDWVVLNGPDVLDELAGMRFSINSINGSILTFDQIDPSDGRAWQCSDPEGDLTKINPKPETTTWDKMADIWTPEGVSV